MIDQPNLKFTVNTNNFLYANVAKSSQSVDLTKCEMKKCHLDIRCAYKGMEKNIIEDKVHTADG